MAKRRIDTLIAQLYLRERHSHQMPAVTQTATIATIQLSASVTPRDDRAANS